MEGWVSSAGILASKEVFLEGEDELRKLSLAVCVSLSHPFLQGKRYVSSSGRSAVCSSAHSWRSLEAGARAEAPGGMLGGVDVWCQGFNRRQSCLSRGCWSLCLPLVAVE